MKSGRQKRKQIDARRTRRREEPLLTAAAAERRRREAEFEERLQRGEVRVNLDALAPTNSYGSSFMLRGTYVATPFECKTCGKAEVWTPHQQKWWYEVAKGDPNSGPSRCRSCRAVERRRKSEARRVHLEGVARKRNL